MTPWWPLALVLLLVGCMRVRPPLPVMQTVPPFTLTTAAGTPFHSDSLHGQVWVADFIFTTCDGPCPRMTSQMRQVQDALAGVPQLKLVSFTVDPEHDTPEAMAQYAKRQKADPNRWVFLTGPRQTLHSLCREAFLLGNVDGTLNHSTRFVLVDRECRVRGYYDTSEASSIPKLIGDIRSL